MNATDLLASQLIAASNDSEMMSDFVKGFDGSFTLDRNSGVIELDSNRLAETLNGFLPAQEQAVIIGALTQACQSGYGWAKGADPLRTGFPWHVVDGFVRGEQPIPRMIVRDLGLTRATTVDGIKAALNRRFASLPDFLQQPESLRRLSLYAGRPKDNPDGSGWDPMEGDTPRPPRRIPIPPQPPRQPLPSVESCLFDQNAWSFHPFLVQVCLSSSCAESLADWLDIKVSDFAGATLDVVKAALTGASSLTAFPVWVALCIFRGYLRISILTANNDSQGRGVCIKFYWIPWLWPPFFQVLPPIAVAR